MEMVLRNLCRILTKKKIKKPDSVYFSNNSITGYIANNIAFPLSYGSADL